MSEFGDRILREFPVRRKPQEKERFRLWLTGTLREMGYPTQLQSRETALRVGGHVTNVVAGDPETAKLLLIAHYDTGIRTLFPPLIAPTRPLTGFLYMALTPVCVLLGSFALSMLPTALITIATDYRIDLSGWALPLFLLLLVAALAYLRFGPSETRNVDDNTSGVTALLETAAALTPRYRGEVAFVFLDGGFGGLSGAKGFRARYPSAKEKSVINLNCVAQGTELLILPNKYSRWNGEMLDAINESFACGETKTVFLKTDGLTYYPSDNRAFRYSFAICACEQVKGFGRLILPRKAKNLDSENLQVLRDGLCNLAAKYQG